jgi:5-methylcytosine-specific restriction endonuclease McrA
VTYGWPRGSDRLWRKLRAQKLEAEPRCEPCLAKGKLSQAAAVHHRTPISRVAANTIGHNLESVCDECHNLAHGGRHPTNLDGTPSDPNHPWNR